MVMVLMMMMLMLILMLVVVVVMMIAATNIIVIINETFPSTKQWLFIPSTNRTHNLPKHIIYRR
jgi:hypothetical protein